MSEELGMVLAGELNRPSVADALPSDFNRARFIQNTVALVQENEQLSRIPQAKLVPALMKGAYLGLDFFNKECYAIPYGQQVQFTPSYTGMVKLAKRFSKRPLVDVYAHIVRDGDEFESGVEDGREYVRFKPKPFHKPNQICAFFRGWHFMHAINKRNFCLKEVFGNRFICGNHKVFNDLMHKVVVVTLDIHKFAAFIDDKIRFGQVKFQISFFIFLRLQDVRKFTHHFKLWKQFDIFFITVVAFQNSLYAVIGQPCGAFHKAFVYLVVNHCARLINFHITAQTQAFNAFIKAANPI